MSFSTVKMQLAVSYSLNMLHRLLTGSEQQVQQNFFSLNIFFMQKPHNEYQALSCYIYPFTYPSIRSVKLLSCVQSFATPWTAARQASLFITNSWSLLKHRSIDMRCHSMISSSINGVSDQIRSVTQSCPTLCDPINRSMPGLPVHHMTQ